MHIPQLGSAGGLHRASGAATYRVTGALRSTDSVGVYRARAETLAGASEDVVLKVAHDSRGTELIANERAALVALGRPGHPGLVRLLDQGEQDGLPWIALPWLGELALVDSLEAGRQGPSWALADTLPIIDGLARALGYVHAQGWAHGDVSPGNVVLRGSQAVLVDLGSARVVPRRQYRLCEPLRVDAATPGYVAPERLLGRAWDGRSDVYALGCVWFELLTGRPLFEGADGDSIARQHVSRPLPDLAACLPALPPDILKLLGSLLVKDPYARPADLTEISRRLCAARASDEHDVSTGPVLSQSRLFGRAEELTLLQRRLRRTADGSGGVVLVSGARGSGRTRLLREAAREASALHFEVLLFAPREEVADAAPPASRLERSLREAPQAAAWIVICDDVDQRGEQWRDTVSIAAAAPQSDRILLIGAVAEGTAEARRCIHALSTHESFTSIALRPVSREAARRIASDVLGPDAGAALLDQLSRHSGGSPGALWDEIERLAREQGLARDAGSRWAVSIPPGAAALAARSRELMEERAARAPGAREWKRALARLRRDARPVSRGAPRGPAARAHLEAAFVEARRHCEDGPVERRLALRLGYILLCSFSRAADHNSVQSLGDELLALAEGDHPRLEAKIHRLCALSYRITGSHADALLRLDAGLARLATATAAGNAQAAARERIANRLDAAWVYYADHDAERALSALRAIAPQARRLGTPAQRAGLHLQLANALCLKLRYAYSARVVQHERRALAIHRRHATAEHDRAAARFELGFMLLLGGAEECAEAVQVLERAAADAAGSEDVTLITRIAAYLAIAYRRTRRLDACFAQSQLVFELARDCGQHGYVGVGHACLGWVALHRNELSDALGQATHALRIWQRRRSADVSRSSEYPFQWLALLPLVAIAVAEERAPQSLAWISDLTHPTQARLCAPVDAELERACTGGAAWDADAWHAWGERLVRAAAKHRYL